MRPVVRAPSAARGLAFGRSLGVVLGLLLALAAAPGCALFGGGALPGRGDGGRPRYDLVITGNASFSARRLAEAAADDFLDFERRGMPKSAVDDAAWTIETYYRARGFPFVRAAYELVPAGTDDTGRATPTRVVIAVDEGPRVVLDEVLFRGNTAFTDDELSELQPAPRAGWFETGPPYYVETQVEAQLAAIASLYWGSGYLRADVSAAEPVFREERTRATLQITVDEGIPYRVARIDLAGGPDGLAAPEELVQQAVAGYVGEPYFPQVGFSARARLLEFYGARGHPDATVTFDETRDDVTGEVVLAFVIVPGPVVTVSRIDVDGIERTEEAFVLERLALEAGEPWSVEKQRQSEADLYRSGLFKTLDVSLEPGDGTERALHVTVDERLPREIFVEPGYGSYERLRVTGGYRDRNVFGDGRTIHATGSLSEKAHRVLAGLTDPWFWDGYVTADLTIFQGRREEPSFTSEEFGAVASVTRRHDARWQTTYGYTLKRSKVSHVQVVTPAVEEALATVNIASLGVAPLYDSRDDPFAPSRGTLLRSSLEGGGAVTGSELDFLRARLEWSWFLPFARRSVLGVSFRTGVIAPLAGTEVIPLQERFFNGGENTVRSFTEDQLGPKDANGEPLGGEAMTVFSIEARQPLSGHLDGAVFYDLGNVEADHADYFRFSDRAEAIGVGLRYMLPIGPLRIDWAMNPDPGDGEDHSVLHATVGMPF